MRRADDDFPSVLIRTSKKYQIWILLLQPRFPGFHIRRARLARQA